MNMLDQTVLKRFLTTLFLEGLLLLLFFMAIRTQKPMIMLIIPLLLLVLMLFERPASLLLIMIFMLQAQIRVPGFPGGLEIHHIIMTMLLAWWVLSTLINKESKSPESDVTGRFLLLFAGNLIITAAYRGTGLAIFGSDQQGGMAYIYLLIALLFYFVHKKMSLTVRQINVLIIGTLIAAFVPAFVQGSIILSGEKTLFLTKFVGIAFYQVEDSILEQDITKARWGSIGGVSTALITIALVFPAIRRKALLMWGIIGVAVVLNLFSGFRSSLVGMGAVVFIWLVYDTPNRKQTILFLMILGFIAWVVAIALLPLFTPQIQRTFSFLPLAAERISDPSILQNAQRSLEFRIEIWDTAWKNTPKYLLIGRGLSVDTEGWSWLARRWYLTPEFFYHSHAYHSGPLGLLVDTGIVGFCAALGFMVSTCVKGWRGVRRFCEDRNTLISRYYAFLVVSFTYQAVAYFLIFGDIRETIPLMVVQSVLISIFYRKLKGQCLELESVAVENMNGRYDVKCEESREIVIV